MSKIYIHSIQYNRSLVDGPGVRTVVFMQGCDLRCEGCHNQIAWNIEDGEEFSTQELAELLKQNVVNQKVTFSGGEPLMQYDALIELIALLEDFDIAVYTGHELRDVPQELLKKIRYIKTGPYVQELRTTTTPYVGSTNQIFRRLN